MVEPSPCPRCGGPRAWIVGATGVSHGPTVPVNCGGCGREAHACPQCGWEWTGLPRAQRMSRRGTCISCQVLELAGRRQRQREAEEATMPTAFAATFDSTRARSRLLQRLADAGESAAVSRYRAYRLFADVAQRASRRADAVARLEAQLRDDESGAFDFDLPSPQ